MSTPLLLDTNAWLRAFGRIGELNAASQAMISDAGNAPLALSAISIWEVCTKVRRKPAELSLTIPLDDWLRVALPPRFIRVLPLDAEIARLSQELPGSFHEDPADRFVVATARKHGMTLLTSDRLILAYPHVRSFDTR